MLGPRRNAVNCAACVALLVIGASSIHGAKAKWTPEQEERVGKKAAEQLVEEFDVVEDKEQLARLQHIVDTLAAVSERPEVQYQVQILNMDAANAVSIPGGYVFVTRGLLHAVESDDELAGVLAHEMAHNCLYHAMQQLAHVKEYEKYNLLAVLATLILRGRAAAVRWVQGPYGPVRVVMTPAEAVRLTTRGLLSGYSVEVEAEADAHAVQYMYKSPYSPVGLLAFIERLAREARRDVIHDPRIFPWGVYQTHPPSQWRALQILAQLQDLGVNVSRELVTKWSRARMIPSFVAGKPAAEVELFEECVFAAVAVSPAGEEPVQRAQRMAEKLNDAVAEGLQQFEVTPVSHADRYAVVARGQTLVRVYAEDAEAHGKTMAELANDCAAAVRRALIRQDTRHR